MAQLRDQAYRTLPASEVRVGQIVQALHGDTRWEACLAVQYDHPAEPFFGAVAITTQDADGSVRLRFWSTTQPVKVFG